MIDYINKMIADEILESADKIMLLKEWQNKCEEKMFNTILTTNELGDLGTYILHIKNCITKLEKELIK